MKTDPLPQKKAVRVDSIALTKMVVLCMLSHYPEIFTSCNIYSPLRVQNYQKCRIQLYSYYCCFFKHVINDRYQIIYSMSPLHTKPFLCIGLEKLRRNDWILWFSSVVSWNKNRRPYNHSFRWIHHNEVEHGLLSFWSLLFEHFLYCEVSTVWNL